MARKLHFGQPHPDVNEFLDVQKIHLNELYRAVISNEISDPKTNIAIMKAKALLD